MEPLQELGAVDPVVDPVAEPAHVDPRYDDVPEEEDPDTDVEPGRGPYE